MTKGILVILLTASLAWSQQVTLSGQFSLTGQRSTSPYTILYSTDFESEEADLVPTWDYNLDVVNATRQSTIKHAGTYAGQFHFIAAADDNLWVSKLISPAVYHVFMRGYLYMKTPEGGLDTVIIQRKLTWVSDATSADGSGDTHATLLNSYTGTGGSPTPTQIYLMVLGQGAACYGGQATAYDIAILSWNTWYSLEIELQTNTPSASPPYDGIVRVWVDGVQVLNRTDFKVNGNCSTPFQFFSIGRQLSQGQSEEYRYWDDVKVSTGYIGP